MPQRTVFVVDDVSQGEVEEVDVPGVAVIRRFPKSADCLQAVHVETDRSALIVAIGNPQHFTGVPLDEERKEKFAGALRKCFKVPRVVLFGRSVTNADIADLLAT